MGFDNLDFLIMDVHRKVLDDIMICMIFKLDKFYFINSSKIYI